MLESSLVSFTLATFYAFDRWLAGDGPRWLVAASVCFGLLALTKIYLLVWIVPLAALAAGVWRNPRYSSTTDGGRWAQSASWRRQLFRSLHCRLWPGTGMAGGSAARTAPWRRMSFFHCTTARGSTRFRTRCSTPPTSIVNCSTT